MIRKGFTLIEVVIVIGIFSIVSLVGVDAYLNGFQNDQRTQIQNKVMQDAKYIMDSLVSEIKSKEIDYEEYFSQCVMQGACPNKDLNNEENRPVEKPKYGINHGYYAWQFYFGGFLDLAQTKEDGFGTRCQTNNGTAKYPSDQCVTGPLPFSEDSNTGINPKTTSLETADIVAESVKSSAICGQKFQLFGDNEDGIITRNSLNLCQNGNSNVFNELYLYDPTSKQKTIIGKRKIGKNAFGLAKLELEMQALNNDAISLPISGYTCLDKYVCTGVYDKIESTNETNFNQASLVTPDRYSLYENENEIYLDFIPVSPLSVSVKDVKFLINPLENPTRAYREPGLTQPTVTILLEIEPSNQYKLPFFSNNFNLKLQATVSTAISTNQES